jgi:hypothetical protein
MKVFGYARVNLCFYAQLETDRSTAADEHLDARQRFAILTPAQEMN